MTQPPAVAAFLGVGPELTTEVEQVDVHVALVSELVQQLIHLGRHQWSEGGGVRREAFEDAVAAADVLEPVLVEVRADEVLERRRGQRSGAVLTWDRRRR